MSAPRHASLRAFLSYEPAILNGLSWRLFGTTAAAALVIASYGVVGGLLSDDVGWSISNVVRHLTIGALIPIIAILLINARRPPLHKALALARSASGRFRIARHPRLDVSNRASSFRQLNFESGQFA